MSEKEIESLINSQNICRIAFNGKSYPYLVPFRYVRSGETFYFHFTDYGKKMKLLEKDNRVCAQIESYKPDLSDYNFVTIRGELKIVEDPEEYRDIIQLFRETGSSLSEKFLAAHGIEPSQGWEEFKVNKGLVLIKLVKIKEKIGLKSP